MPDDNEIQRLAAMANALRPEWPIRSLTTHLRAKHSARSYRDLAVAIAWIAADPSTKTPARLAEPGPWWQATAATSGLGFERFNVKCPVHPEQPAGRCQPCVDAAVPRPEWVVVPVPNKHKPVWDEPSQEEVTT